MRFELDRIKRPALLLDEARCRANIRNMADRARKSGVIFRPHFKTHQSKNIGRWFREEGVTAITVASVPMAAYFIEDGWHDITIAFPLNLRETDEIRRLTLKADLNILVTQAGTLEEFAREFKGNSRPAGVFIKTDTGYHRTGLLPSDIPEIEKIISICRKNPLLIFKGFLTHAGQTYLARGREEIEAMGRESIRQMKTLQEAGGRGSHPLLSVGDTPSCSILGDFGGMHEIRPGNFVFYDVMQTVTGSCSQGDIAVCLAVPVVSKDAGRREILVCGGAVHLSRELLKWKGHSIFGLITRLSPEGWDPPMEGCYVNSLSQEHGVIRVNYEAFATVRPGDLLGILPVHSCLTAQCMGSYLLPGSETADHM
jgi:D-serine deaminase-like pyridoxal phosphate-dependent protein